jgi:hypothetical protein
MTHFNFADGVKPITNLRCMFVTFWIFNSLFIGVFGFGFRVISPARDFRLLLAEPLFYWSFHNLGAFLWSRFSVGFPSLFGPNTFVAKSSLKYSCPGDFDCGGLRLPQLTRYSPCSPRIKLGVSLRCRSPIPRGSSVGPLFLGISWVRCFRDSWVRWREVIIGPVPGEDIGAGTWRGQ